MRRREEAMNTVEYIQYRETKVHEQPGFAYNTYLCTIPLDFPKVALHWHDEMELIYIKKGSGEITLDLNAYEVCSGSIAVVPPGCLHSISSEEHMEYENIIFSVSLLETSGDDWCSRSFFSPLKEGRLFLPRMLEPGTELQRRASAFLDAADRACDRKKDGYPLEVKGDLFLFLSALYECRSESKQERDGKNSEKMKHILAWIREHCAEHLTVAEAAKEAGYSPAHFMRFFRENSGQTFIAYLQDYRLSSALRLLSVSGEPISSIALSCGFENISYFCRSFRKKYGCTPHEMRQDSHG
jgi:AraC-like DNA-binding protein/mannose-6-phosphate isomerase-like protein (cupin superfamily)